MTGSTSEIVHEALPIDDPRVRCPDISKARTLLGWTPQVDLSEGLSRVLDYELSTESHSVTGLPSGVLEKTVTTPPRRADTPD